MHGRAEVSIKGVGETCAIRDGTKEMPQLFAAW